MTLAGKMLQFVNSICLHFVKFCGMSKEYMIFLLPRVCTVTLMYHICSIVIVFPHSTRVIHFQNDFRFWIMSSPVEKKRAEPWANLLAGGVGGFASLVIGHPFDTVKVSSAPLT